MKTLLIATALSALVFAPVGAFAQSGGNQTTESQQDLKDGVKAQPRTQKREEIIRSESNKPDHTNGAAPATAPR